MTELKFLVERQILFSAHEFTTQKLVVIKKYFIYNYFADIIYNKIENDSQINTSLLNKETHLVYEIF